MAIESVLAYGAPIWNEAAQKQVYRKKLISAQRLMVLRICPAGPGRNSAEERNRLFKYNSIDQNTKRMEREETIKKWQHESDGSKKGVWTRRLIKDAKCWATRKWGRLTTSLPNA